MAPITDVELERINNWLRINLFRVADAANEGSLTAQNVMRVHRLLQENPRSAVMRESMLRHIDAFDRAYERRIAYDDRRQYVQPGVYEVSVPVWAVLLVLAALLVVGYGALKVKHRVDAALDRNYGVVYSSGTIHGRLP